MPANDKDLKKAKGGLLAPQYYDPSINDYDYQRGKDGASFVAVRSIIIKVIFQDQATTAGNGNSFTPDDGNYKLTFEITGTSTSRTVVFEMAGPSGVYIPVTAFNVTDPTKFGTQTTGGSSTAPESWQVEVPAEYSFRARIGAVAGGNVTIKGKAVST